MPDVPDGACGRRSLTAIQGCLCSPAPLPGSHTAWAPPRWLWDSVCRECRSEYKTQNVLSGLGEAWETSQRCPLGRFPR